MNEEKKLADAERRVAEAQAGEELREARKAKAAATRKKNKEAKEATARIQVEDAATKAAVEAVAASLQGSSATGRKSTRKHSEVEDVAANPIKQPVCPYHRQKKIEKERRIEEKIN